MRSVGEAILVYVFTCLLLEKAVAESPLTRSRLKLLCLLNHR